MRVSRSSPFPLYFQVADDLRRRIGEGEWPPGASLPSEIELGERYGVARGTVRQALGALRAEGVISGGRGRPSAVRPQQRLEQSFASLVSFSQWARSTGHDATAEVIDAGFGAASDEEAEMLDLCPAAVVWRC